MFGISPRLAAFDYVARAITPPDSPIRFHARFFLAAAPGLGMTLASYAGSKHSSAISRVPTPKLTSSVYTIASESYG